MRVRKVISCLLVIAMLASMSTAFAATDSRGTTPVKLETEALDFSVTVPTSLPVSIAADGEVTVATDAKIVNNSAGSIEVKNVSVEAVTPWELTTWSDTDNLSTEKVNSKKFALSLQGTGVLSNGTCSAKFNSIVANGDLGLLYNAHVSPQSNALTGEQISNIVFTLGWNKATNNFAENEISSLSLDKGSLVMYVGTSETIHATAETKAQVAQLFSMRAAEDNGVTWSVDNENVSVENGKVTANSLGESVVTASYEGLDAVCRVNVINAPVPLEAISFTKNKVTLFKGESETVLLTYNPDKFTGVVDVSIASNNDNVTVAPASLAGITGQDGPTEVTITGNKGGTSVVTATVVVDGKTLTSEIEVEVIVPLESLTIDGSTSVTEDESIILTVVKTPVDAAGEVVWSSSDPSKATVDQNGVVTGVAEGEVTIKAECGGIVSSKTVVVETAVVIPEASIDWEYTTDDATNTITLTKYIGENLDVVVHNKYKAGGKVYNTVMGSSAANSGPFVGSAKRTSLISITFEDRVILPQDCGYMFKGCSKLTNLNTSSFDTSHVTNMAGMFSGCLNLASLDVSNFDTSNVTNMGSMFYNCTTPVNLDVSNFDTSKVLYMDSMFYGCYHLTSLNLSNFDTGNVTSMSNMFGGCFGLTNLDLSNFDTGNVINMSGMFDDCSYLTNLDISNFNTSKVTKMIQMFNDCLALETIYASSLFNTAKVTFMTNMFNGCSKLVGGNGTAYDSNHTDGAYARIDTPSTPGYFTAKP